jgi:hypothetical protein
LSARSCFLFTDKDLTGKLIMESYICDKTIFLGHTVVLRMCMSNFESNTLRHGFPSVASGIVLDNGIREQLLAETSEELEHERKHIVFTRCRQNAVFLKAI